MQIQPPHIPLGISLEEGLKILNSVSADIEKLPGEREDFYKVGAKGWECGFYSKGDVVRSSWFNDPLGRESQEGIDLKIDAYLARYGSIDDWEEGLNNGWIQFFLNKNAGVGMAYGLDKDVLRFNSIG